MLGHRRWPRRINDSVDTKEGPASISPSARYVLIAKVAGTREAN